MGEADNTVTSISGPGKEERVDSYLDKCVVTHSNTKLLLNEELSSTIADIPKFKWGDLDEAMLVHYSNIAGGEVKSGSVENQNLVSIKAGKLHPCGASLDTHENGLVKEATDEDQVLPKCHSLSPISVSEGETSNNEVNEVPAEDVKEQITSEQMVSKINSISDREYLNMKSSVEPYTGEGETIRKGANSKSKSGDHSVSVQPVPDPASSMPSIEESGTESCKSNSGDITDAIISDVDGESKERFRERLWCFLFENLNRAVDELYLLCELECDLDQMKEASLVLEEAASDFNELKSRVEKFEKSKRSSHHEIEGARITLQSDHRRPHALSWEVRRMTTSPRRAEILSSSLEAFRKIQQERSSERNKNAERLRSDFHSKSTQKNKVVGDSKETAAKARMQPGLSDMSRASTKEKRNLDSVKSVSANAVNRRSNRELQGSACEGEKMLLMNEKTLTEQNSQKDHKSAEPVRKSIVCPEREREKGNGNLGKPLDAWKEKRNWEDILASPHRISSRFSYSPGIGRKSAERVRVLHDKLMSPEKKKKSAVDLKKEAEEKHARATRIRTQLENERVQKLQRTSEKLNRVNEWQTVRSTKLRESLFARHQRSESRHEAYLAQVVRRAGDESSKVNEVRFITSLNEENKKHMLRKKLQDSELRRTEKLQIMKTKQKEDMAREEAVLERKRLIEAEKLQRLAETQRRKEEAQVRREEERKASSAAREAKAMEQMRKKEVLAKTRQEEAELLAQRLAERLSESEQRRKFYLEQIRERASMDFRDQSSPLFRRSSGKDGQAPGRSSCGSGEDNLANKVVCSVGSDILTSEALQHSLKRRIKKIRQRLMSLKHEFPEPSLGLESSSIGYRTAVGTARGKISRWLQDLQKLRQARKDGAATFGLITAEMIKFLDGRDAELHAARQAGLLDFIASALPASYTSKPEACQVTIYLLRLLRIVLTMSANRCYFLVQNLLPPIIPMLAAALENYIKIAASSNSPGAPNSISSKTSGGTLELVSEVVDGFLWTVGAIIGHSSCNDLQLQMQDGLVELVIAYQIIHRLRDLFALYDRPQVEGSPFPSSILLSIDFLVVLTSKFRVSSSIDWESFPDDVINEFKPEKKIFPQSAYERSTSCNSCGDNTSPSLTAGSLRKHLIEQEQLGPVCDLGGKIDEKPVQYISQDTDQIVPMAKTVDVLDESLRIIDKRESSITPRDGSISVSHNAEQNNSNHPKQPAIFLLSAMSETGLVCLPSMLTAVLLQANNRLSAEQSILPSNFEEVATGVLKVLNNLALIDVTFIQKMLSRPDLKMEFFHLMSFLLSYCTTNWGVATDKIGLLLLETLSLLGYFSLFHPENQAVLRWGNSQTILHKVCDLPFVFFSDPELMPMLAGTLVAASYGCELNKEVIQQELSMDILLPSLRSCKSNLSLLQDGPSADDSCEPNQVGHPESRKLQPERLPRAYLRSSRVLPQRGGGPGGSTRTMNARNQKEIKMLKLSEELIQSDSDTSALMLHCRFPLGFIEKAEQFFIINASTST